jgi:hypothetical protein
MVAGVFFQVDGTLRCAPVLGRQARVRRLTAFLTERDGKR